jgi:hypothetical protein
MTRRTFRELDLKAAIKAVTAAGKDIAAVEIGPDGQIRITIGEPTVHSPPLNPWNEVLDGPTQ